MNIRPEQIQDKGRVATLIARTYGAHGATVIEIAGKLRNSATDNQGLGYVEAEGEQVNGFVLFTPLETAKGKAALLAPFAADPQVEDFDSTSFLEGAMQNVSAKGFRYIVLLSPMDEVKDGFLGSSDIAVELGEGMLPENVRIKDMGADAGEALSGLINLPECLR